MNGSINETKKIIILIYQEYNRWTSLLIAIWIIIAAVAEFISVVNYISGVSDVICSENFVLRNLKKRNVLNSKFKLVLYWLFLLMN